MRGGSFFVEGPKITAKGLDPLQECSPCGFEGAPEKVFRDLVFQDVFFGRKYTAF